MTFYLHYRYLGVTPPISVAESNKREKEVTVTLMEELRNQNTFETEAESRTRWVLFLLLESWCSVWLVFLLRFWFLSLVSFSLQRIGLRVTSNGVHEGCYWRGLLGLSD